jgi:hypothetical protein
MKVANRSFENAARLKNLKATVINKNLIHEEIKKRLKSGKAYCHSAKQFLFSRLLSENLKIKI